MKKDIVKTAIAFILLAVGIYYIISSPGFNIGFFRTVFEGILSIF